MGWAQKRRDKSLRELPFVLVGATIVLLFLYWWEAYMVRSGLDGGEVTTTDLTLTLMGLTPGRTYYVRVLARNTQGSGLFSVPAKAAATA
jgi:hypothetical protein